MGQQKALPADGERNVATLIEYLSSVFLHCAEVIAFIIYARRRWTKWYRGCAKERMSPEIGIFALSASTLAYSYDWFDKCLSEDGWFNWHDFVLHPTDSGGLGGASFNVGNNYPARSEADF